MALSTTQGPCPCGSGKHYSECCGPLHDGSTTAKTAEALMRARYSAFVVGNEDFLQLSWHASTRPQRVLEKDADKTQWSGLKIIDCVKGGAGDSEGTVEFIARFTIHKQAGQLHEVSSFTFEDDRWLYVDGENKKGETVRSEKVGRNEPCPCGSGKKYKKCCGK